MNFTSVNKVKVSYSDWCWAPLSGGLLFSVNDITNHCCDCEIQ